MLIVNITEWVCDHCGQAATCSRLQAAAEDGDSLPFLMLWICAPCLRRLATFTDQSRPPAS